MIQDLQLMKDITPLFKKKIVIWGIGEKGRLLIEELKAMGAGEKGIFLCDSDYRLWGSVVSGEEILSPKDLHKEIKDIDSGNIIILVSVVSIKAQDEILKNIENLFGNFVDVCTWYAIEWGLYFNIKNPNVDSGFKKKKMEEHAKKRLNYNERSLHTESALKYFAFLPLHNDEIILIYQPGKVASSSLYNSIRQYNRNVLHCHMLTGIGNDKDSLYNLLNVKSGKIISLVRDPVARQISAMWHCMTYVNRYSAEVDFSEIEQYYFKDKNENLEFEWYDWEMKNVFKIDIYEYPFDKEKGYSIIKEGNIELLLIKMEKLSELEEVIGKFLNIDHFRLQSTNIGKDKPYRFALQAYKQCFAISQEKLEDIYRKNEYVKHFYTEQERNDLYMKWLNHADY